MIKKYKKTIIITNLIIILPMIVGLILWNQLPDQIATHFDMNGKANGWSPKYFAVFGLPLLMLVVDWICIAATVNDPKRKNISNKMFLIVLWIIPIASLVTVFSCYASALGINLDMSTIVYIMLGIIFVMVGNYLPKSKQSYTMGIKVPWTLNSKENWNRTHRLAGWMWMVCGVIIFINAFFKLQWLMLLVILVAAFVPMAYSYLLYRKGI